MEVLKYHVPTIANDTFKEYEKSVGQKEMGNKKKSRNTPSTKCMHVQDIIIENEAHALAAADTLMLQICTNTESAEVVYSDKDLFFKYKSYCNGAAAENRSLIERIKVDRIYIKDDMWIGVDTDSLGATHDFDIEIGYKWTYINDWQLARMIASKV